MNPNRRQPDRCAFVCSVFDRLVSRISVISSDVNRHMRLKTRCIASTGQIIDDSLKEAVCRLGRDEPVCNDGLPGHEIATAFGSTPLLQLDDITFRIACINQTNPTNVFYFRRGNFSHFTPTGCDHCF